MTQSLASLNPTTRFSNRVENYVKYRPSYPDAIVAFLEKNIRLQKDQRIVDVGSGTGIFSELFLKHGYHVVGIEPNDEMRKAAEKRLSIYTGFTSKNHRAEQTGLRKQSVDLITVAQAFHWMDPALTKKEFLRILKPGGHIVLAWNLRLKNTPFLKAYDALKLQFGTDYKAAKMVNEESIQSFYTPMLMKIASFENRQVLDFEGLKGQLLSTSYIPLPDHTDYEQMIEQLVKLFIVHNEKGFVQMVYETKVYFNG
ncbi:MAG TPA: class I SAM-dependent methyltransferase [Puia sp.]|jgi:ubiquinone/menaquinone biosynthesis C-methylase UbiE|nr:class I SAM-dependent methyltransferase [Puia sp.]